LVTWWQFDQSNISLSVYVYKFLSHDGSLTNQISHFPFMFTNFGHMMAVWPIKYLTFRLCLQILVTWWQFHQSNISLSIYVYKFWSHDGSFTNQISHFPFMFANFGHMMAVWPIKYLTFCLCLQILPMNLHLVLHSGNLCISLTNKWLFFI
jgi:hypothetical protein